MMTFIGIIILITIVSIIFPAVGQFILSLFIVHFIWEIIKLIIKVCLIVSVIGLLLYWII